MLLSTILINIIFQGEGKILQKEDKKESDHGKITNLDVSHSLSLTLIKKKKKKKRKKIYKFVSCNFNLESNNSLILYN